MRIFNPGCFDKETADLNYSRWNAYQWLCLLLISGNDAKELLDQLANNVLPFGMSSNREGEREGGLDPPSNLDEET